MAAVAEDDVLSIGSAVDEEDIVLSSDEDDEDDDGDDGSTGSGPGTGTGGAGAGAGAGAGTGAASTRQRHKAQGSDWPNRPLQLVRLVAGSADKFEICEEAVEVLEDLEGPLAIVAVAGKARTGKSYLLNRLCGAEHDGFAVGAAVQHCTEGIWMWGAPIEMTTPDGVDVSVLFLDTEGLGDSENQDHDGPVMLLATLLCSTLVYNCKVNIDEGAINQLAVVTQYAIDIQSKVAAEKRSKMKSSGSAGDLGSFFPNFVWLVRDWFLGGTNADPEDGEYEYVGYDDDNEDAYASPKEYMEKQLARQPGYSAAAKSHNHPRDQIDRFFANEQRDCFTIVRPITDEDGLGSLEEHWDDVRSQFKSQLNQFKKNIFSKWLRVKTHYGRQVSGRVFVGLAKQYVAAINSKKGLVMDELWEHVAEDECKAGKESAMEVYNTLMAPVLAKLPVDDEELEEAHNHARATAFKAFGSKAMGGASAEYKKELKKEMTKIGTHAATDNRRLAKAACKALLESLRQKHLAEFYSQDPAFSDHKRLKAALKALAEEYHTSAVGGDKMALLAKAMQSEVTTVLKAVNASRAHQMEDMRHEFEDAVAQTENDLARQTAMNEALEERIQSAVADAAERSRLEVELESMHKRHSALIDENVEYKTQADAATRKAESAQKQLRDAKAESAAQVTALNSQLDAEHAKVGQAEAALREAQASKGGCCSIM